MHIAEQKLSLAIRNMTRQVTLKDLKKEDLPLICQQIILNDPYSFAFDGYSYTEEQNGLTIFPNYSMSWKRYRYLSVLIDNFIQECISDLSSYEPAIQIKKIHDRLRQIITYDSENTYCHSVIGPCIHGKGACDGISKTFKVACDQIGIECIVVSGLSTQTNHAWNQVHIENEWYNVDVTYDLPGPGSGTHDYLLISDNFFHRNHRPQSKCNDCHSEKYDPFYNARCAINTIADIEQKIFSSVTNPYYCSFRLNNMDLEPYVDGAVKNALRMMGKSCDYNLYFDSGTGIYRLSLTFLNNSNNRIMITGRMIARR